jgi:hypothetical protein
MCRLRAGAGKIIQDQLLLRLGIVRIELAQIVRPTYTANSYRHE